MTEKQGKSKWFEMFFSSSDPNWGLYVLLMGYFLIQLIGITDPPLEMAHSWRQSFTAMVTRNYFEFGMDWLYPRIDMAGEKSGIVGAEFPLFNFLSLLLNWTFGYQHWYGRLVNLVAVIWGTFHFFQFIQSLISRQVAWYALLILLCSSWFTFSRKIMPDTFSVSLVIVGLNHGYQYLVSGRWTYWFAALVTIALGVLSKIPAMSLLAVMVVLFIDDGTCVRRKRMLFFGAALSLIPAIIWYFVWVPHLNETYGYHLFFPKGLLEGIIEILPLWQLLFEKFYFTSFYSFLALAFLMVGFFALCKKGNKKVLLAMGSLALVFLLFILKTGGVFPLHTYYSVPFVPVMAVLSGLGLGLLAEKLNRPKMIVFLMVLMCFEGISNQFHDHFIKPSENYKLALENGNISSTIPPNAMVVFVTSANPQELFLLHRKGWTVYPEQLDSKKKLNEFVSKGAEYLVINLAVVNAEWINQNLKLTLGGQRLMYRSKDYLVYRLNGFDER